MSERGIMTVVLCLTIAALASVFTAVALEAAGKSSPTWLGTLAGAAAGGILTLAQPLRNGAHNAGPRV
jgi:hypothetical protein